MAALGDGALGGCTGQRQSTSVSAGLRLGTGPGRLALCPQPLVQLPFHSPRVKRDGRAPAPPHHVEIDVVV